MAVADDDDEVVVVETLTCEEIVKRKFEHAKANGYVISIDWELIRLRYRFYYSVSLCPYFLIIAVVVKNGNIILKLFLLKEKLLTKKLCYVCIYGR